MKKSIFFILFLTGIHFASAQEFPKDIFPTTHGELTISFIGHASLMFIWNDMVMYVDPVMREADFNQFPEADVIFITHHHGDHLDKTAIKALMKDSLRIIMPEKVSEQVFEMDISHKNILGEWESVAFNQLECEAIPAYNIEHTRENGEPYHPRGVGVGYVIRFGNFRVMIGGDTENIPEYARLQSYNIDAAFLPMNLPYTMTPEMVAAAARMIQPIILYPYHYGNTDTDRLLEIMRENQGIEVRIRSF